ncbi:alpha/beta-hydrolase, partial [Aureobasidium melanogenum]
NAKALDSDILVEHEVEIVVRDGARLYNDIYQPADSDEKIPAILRDAGNSALAILQNDWEKTPRLNWWLLQFGDRKATENILIEDFPVPNTDYREFYLDQDKKLPTNLLGSPKAIIYVSCADTSRDDFTVFIILRKLDKNGKTLYHLNFPIEATRVNSIDEVSAKEMASLNLFSGATGIHRASQREIDESKSVSPNEIVKLEIGTWAMDVHYDAGESISVRIGGQQPSIAEFTSFSGPRPEHELNRGEHIIHSGPDYPSKIILPFVDVKV